MNRSNGKVSFASNTNINVTSSSKSKLLHTVNPKIQVWVWSCICKSSNRKKNLFLRQVLHLVLAGDISFSPGCTRTPTLPNHQPSSPCPWTAGFRPRNLLTKLRRRLLHYLPGERLMHSSIAECRWGVLNTTRLK